jgi:hypothetical protein
MIAILLALVLLASWGYMLYVKLFSEKYTRERFAFASLAATSSVILTAIGQISSSQGLPQVLLSTFTSFFGVAPVYHPDPAPLSEKLLIVVLALTAAAWINRLNKDVWTGQVSVEDHQNRKQHKARSWVLDGFNEGSRILHGTSPRNTYEAAGQLALQTVLDTPTYTVVWHEHAKELVELWSTTLRFSPASEGGWDSVSKCWTGVDLSSHQNVLLFCYAEPTQYDIDQIAADLQRKNGDPRPRALLCSRDPVDCNKIAELPIEILSERFLLDRIADFSDYYLEIRNRVEQNKLTDSELRIPDIYVESELNSSEQQQKPTGLEDCLLGWVAEPAGSQIAILGEYGQGKSTGALMFVYHYLQERRTEEFGRVPILLELRG